MEEKKIKHLEMFQAVIARMANNSFSLKGWSIMVVSALFLLSAKDTNPTFVCLAFFPAASFWILDGYFLRQERLFRKAYDKVRLQGEADIDFSMDTSSVETQVDSWARVTWSVTLGIFHGTVVGTIVVVMTIFFLIR